MMRVMMVVRMVMLMKAATAAAAAAAAAAVFVRSFQYDDGDGGYAADGDTCDRYVRRFSQLSCRWLI